MFYRRSHQIGPLLFAVALWGVMVQSARADIFEWEFIDPANPGQGKRQSVTLVPGGAGLTPASKAFLYHSNLTKAYLIGFDLTEATFFASNLTNADLSQANLTKASAMQANFTNADLINTNLTNSTLQKAVLTNARLTGAIIDGASFTETVQFGFSAGQLYSTANYQSGDLSGINLSKNDLTGWSFTGQNLFGTNFNASIVTNANFTGANIRSANLEGAGVSANRFSLAQLYSTANYANRDLSHTILGDSNFTDGYFAGHSLVAAKLTRAILVRANFADADLSQANLSSANLTAASLINATLSATNLSGSTLLNASLVGANVEGANFNLTVARGFTPAQLYSTASYASGNLNNLKLESNNLAGWDFAGKRLEQASFNSSMLAGTSFHSANLRGAQFSNADLTGAIFSQADIREATFSAFLGGNEISAAQFYSTASYQTGDLMGVGLYYHDLTGWNFAGKNLTGSNLGASDLISSNLRNANLTEARLGWDLSNADLTGATIAGATFEARGFMPNQLYSTASYQNNDLRGIHFISANVSLAGWDLSNQDLSGVEFRSVSLAGTNFSNAIIKDTRFIAINTLTPTQIYSTSSYQNHDLRGIELSGLALDLSGQDISSADLALHWNNTSLANATIRNSRLYVSSSHLLTAAQIHSTASHQAGDMSGVEIEGWGVTLHNWDLSGMDLSHAVFKGHFEVGWLGLNGFNFAGANLTDATFSYAFAQNSNFNGADARGASIPFTSGDNNTTENLIRPDGSVQGLNLINENALVVRDYDNPSGPTRIAIQDGFFADESGSLKLIFDADAWDSTFTFEHATAVTLDGTLHLSFADGVNLALQVGRSIKLFDWSNVTPTGEFTIDSAYVWDQTDLYTLGQIRLISINPDLPTEPPGDFNQDGAVDAADYVLMRKIAGNDPYLYDLWRGHFGQTTVNRESAGHPLYVPEPFTAALLGIVLTALACSPRTFTRPTHPAVASR